MIPPPVQPHPVACVAERPRRFEARPRTGNEKLPRSTTGKPQPEACTYSLVARVVPNALDVGLRSAPLNALGTTRSTTKLKRGARVHPAVLSEPPPPKGRPLEAMNDAANWLACMPQRPPQSVSPAAHRLARCVSVIAGEARLSAWSCRVRRPELSRNPDSASFAGRRE